MNTSQPQPNNVSDSDLALLSAYIDHQLDAPAQAELERRLAREPHLRAELDDLRTTTALLRALPPLAPPRSLTLDPARAPQRGGFMALAWFMQFGSGLAGLVLVLLSSFQLLLGPGATAPVMLSAPPPAAPASTIAQERAQVAAPTEVALAAAVAADSAAPAATAAPTAMAMMVPNMATASGVGARQSGASVPPAISQGGGESYSGAAAESASAAAASSAREASDATSLFVQSATPASKAAPQPPALPPLLFLGLGLLLLSLGSFFYYRHR